MEDVPHRFSRPLLAVGAGAALLAGGGLWLWGERTPIATSYIDDALTARNVPASYRLAQVGLRTQRIEAIRIGDPANPDLTADWAEIELAVGLSGVSVRAIDAGGVKLRGRLIAGKLSLGVLDRLLPEGESDQPFALPDIDLTARSIRLDLATPQGLVRATIDGTGNLKNGFRGAVALGADRLIVGGCIASAMRARLGLAMDGGRPRLRGPVEAAMVDCGSISLSAPNVAVAARGDSDLERWRGSAVLRGGLRASGVAVERLGGAVAFDASAERISGRGDLFAERIRQRGSFIGRAALTGNYRYEPAPGRARVVGTAKLIDARLDPAVVDRLAGQLAAADGTPVAPILGAWLAAAQRAARKVDATAAFAISHSPAGGELRVERLDAAAPGGARLLVRSERAEGLGWRWPQGGAVANASIELDGGGFPRLLMSLRQALPGSPLSGSATMAPYQAGGARLRLTPVRFESGRRGETSISTQVTIDGPLADGRVEGLDLPLALSLGRDGSFVLNRNCAPLRFARIAIAGTVIGRSSLPLCPVDGALVGRRASGQLFGGARIAATRLRGRIGDQPLSLEARSIAVAVARPGFKVAALAVRLGDPAAPTRLDVASLDGSVGARGLAGRFTGAAGKIGAVPLIISEGIGDWSLASSLLTLDGAIQVSDAETASPRFNPLTATDVHLTLKGGRIDAGATLREPRSGLAVTKVSVRHDLSAGKGDALLDVDGLRFGRALQPETITPLTLGMIANVEGALSGKGQIRWADGNVASDGTFQTDGINLAAAFGPVTGLKGNIRFTDLLGLVTAPDQQVTIAEINPGVAVTNGVVRYRILPDRKLAVAEGRWPFAGGTLTLEPTTLDMGQPVARMLTFRIDALDAATFVQQLEFKNIAVTGKFDGVLPIIFDAHGGRIENGFLRVRPGGGTLSYVGDVTNADLGRIARIAFDALKSMRYDRLTIDLNGSLDGEIVSRVRFDGTNDRPKESASSGGVIGRLLAPVTRLPFRFNITITAPFRGLVNSAQTFVDPSIVLRNTAGAARAVPVPPALTQPGVIPPTIQPR